eukprot:CAMPEP_0185019612 /NCGR_PEP_ID=MMETSP1103-20130426/2231_1 /TAXON_ID=36769 /ORGANISM="Paraphysomonas bandaiensis, Strain Caron Lab Isolate" /LENGTH=118 /DNA_ID=CAMNT_0027550031 /DNA_START=78 /DNA_END=434 /DNA_ORIENTATION=-
MSSGAEDSKPTTELSGDFTDKTLTCKDCGNEWVFSAGEQEFYREKAFENDPTRCKECRKAKKIARNRRMRSRRQKKNGPGGNVCYAFQKGECTRGDSCRFAHELVSESKEGNENETVE